MKKKFLSIFLALAIISTMSVTAFAADGDEATAPKDTTPGGGLVVSNGSATITSNDGINFNTENDDDALAKDNDTNGADINVWAKVVDASTPVYKIDIAWGAMKFEYSSGDGTWNTATHTYDGGTGAGAWTTTDYLDGTNNKITLTNHSNKAINASFAYTMETNAFNAANTASSVAANFFADNTKALAAALVLDDTSAVNDKLGVLPIHTADSYYASQSDRDNGVGSITAAGARNADAFFAFSGKPDAGKGADLNTFQKVGVITVTVEPMTDTTGFEY